MELWTLLASLICLIVVIVTGAEESTDILHNQEKETIAKLEEEDHGPLMKALLAPGENSSSESPELQRDKRHKKWYDQQRATWKKGKGGGCFGGCGGGGGGILITPVIVPVVVPIKGKKGGGGGGCGHKGCGGGRPPVYNYPSGGGYCSTCGGGGGGGSYSYSQSSSSSGSWGRKK